jgi:hypothetical protein
MEKPRRKVNVKWMLVSLIFDITALIGFYRIKKFKKGGLLILITGALHFVGDYLLPFPYGTVVSLLFTYPLLIYYMLKWSRAWNASIDAENLPDRPM